MNYLLDSNVVIAMFRGKEKIRQAIMSVGFEHCFVSAVTMCEISVGCHYLGIEDHKHEIQFVRDHFTILPVEPHIDSYGEIRAYLMRNGIAIDDFDIVIGATARDKNLALVTHNRRHLDRIPDLIITDWEV